MTILRYETHRARLALILMLALSVLGLGAVASSPVASAASAPVNCNNHYNYAYIDYALLNPNTPYYSGHNISDCTVIGYTDGQYRNMRIQCKWISGAGVVWFYGGQQASSLKGWVRRADTAASPQPNTLPTC